jgi:O-succinylbenzoic acid--CoA ligase
VGEECLLKAAARVRPEALAVVSADETLTYREYDRRADAHARHLHAVGLSPGDVVGILPPRCVEWLPVLMGCFRAGMTAFPINARLPREAAKTVVQEAGCAILVSPADWRSPNSQTTPQDMPPPNSFGGAPQSSILNPAPPNSFGGGMSDEENSSDQNVSVLLQTSGSTGRPKLAAVSYANFRANAEASNRNIALEPGDVWLLSLPLYHVSGLGVVFRCLAAGATVAVPDEDEDLAESIARYGLTHVSLVTTQLQRLMERPEGVRALQGLKAILLGGSGMPPGLIRKALALGLPVHTSYGLTETASQVATTAAEDRSEEGLRRARVLVPGSLRISAEGEIEVRGPALFLGYREADGRIERPSTPDGWFPTGDLGRLDDEGRLSVSGRKDNLFISGGENVQPEEIERELCALEGVEQAVVVPVEDAEFGQRPVAFVKPAADAEALRAALAKRLPGYKVPVAFYDWPAELDAPGMKIRRVDFRKIAAQQEKK